MTGERYAYNRQAHSTLGFKHPATEAQTSKPVGDSPLNNKLLVISVHPDDETLGCGGTLLKYKDAGDEIYCVYVTDGNRHQAEAIPKLQELYRFTKAFRLGLPEITLEDISLSHIIPLVSGAITDARPTMVLLPNRSDPHSDHRRAFDACQACIKTFRYPYIKKVMMCEIQSETDFSPALPENMFIPTVYVDISTFIEEKMDILRVFDSELLDYPATRSRDSIRAHHRYRGSQANCEYAESFMLLKEIL